MGRRTSPCLLSSDGRRTECGERHHQDLRHPGRDWNQDQTQRLHMCYMCWLTKRWLDEMSQADKHTIFNLMFENLHSKQNLHTSSCAETDNNSNTVHRNESQSRSRRSESSDMRSGISRWWKQGISFQGRVASLSEKVAQKIAEKH